MKPALQSQRVITQAETDQQMLDWLREKMAEKFAEGGPSRRYSEAIVARFAELIDNQSTFKRGLGSIEDAHKLALAQMQFAQSVVRQLERQVEVIENAHRNGKTVPAAVPAIDLKGE